MNLRSINAVIDSIIKPNTCFANVSENTKYYVTTSVVIFLIAGASTILSTVLNTSYWNHDGQSYLDFSVMSLLLSVIHNVLRNFVLIVAIFFVGRKLGGDATFKKTFSVLSYCLIPVIVGALVIPIALTFASSMLFIGGGGSYMGGGTLDLDPDLSPSYALDFASSVIISNGLSIAFGAWMLILFLKATKIVHGFNIKKSIITVASGIAIMFLSQAAFGILPALLFHL